MSNKTIRYTEESLYENNGKARALDIHQDKLSNCYFLAPIGVLAEQQPDRIRDAIRFDAGTGNFTVRPYSPPNASEQQAGQSDADETFMASQLKPSSWRRFIAGSITLCMTVACSSLQSSDSVLDHLAGLPAPQPTLSIDTREMTTQKSEMAASLDAYLDGRYRIIDQRFALSRPGFSEGALLESQAAQYLEGTLKGTSIKIRWRDTGIDLIGVWAIGPQLHRYIAIAGSDDALPNHDNRRLIGYFEMIQSSE